MSDQQKRRADGVGATFEISPSPAHAVTVVTIARNRREHLERQQQWLHESAPGVPHVIVDMGGDPIDGRAESIVVDLKVDDDSPLPLAAARNLGARHADADTLIFLDVDCLPSSGLVTTYLSRVDQFGGVWSGPVGYLPPADTVNEWEASHLSTISHFHEGRPQPGQRPSLAPSLDLFWSLSFAMKSSTFGAIGGFDESFTGYGGEDTDFGRRIGVAGYDLWFDGGALAFHQHHPVSSPPIEHLRDVVANATRFHEKWGEWPMAGWLDAFVQRGLIEWSSASKAIVVLGPASVGDEP